MTTATASEVATAPWSPTHHVKTSLSPESHDGGRERGPVTTFLGWFSLGLGLAEILAPRRLAELTGTRGNERLLQLYGLREVVSGVGILASDRPAGWLWGRVAGDGMDLATLWSAYADGSDEDRPRALAAIAAVAGVTALDVICATQQSHGG